MPAQIPFNKPHLTGKELFHLAQAMFTGHLAGDGSYSKKCQFFLAQTCQSLRALLTHSCTAALEMQALLLELKQGDEVLMPAYTFVSTANAVVLRGAVPVFLDIREDTLNLDERLLEEAITERTRAISCVHYAGVACEMDTILKVAKKHDLVVLEDAAQGYFASYKGRHLGSIGDLGAISFHETKNVMAGEGGALLVNNSKFLQQAEIIREKGTDRSRFFRGEVDKYSWQSLGSSYLPSELTAAFLWAQFEEGNTITQNRLQAWQRYYDLLFDLAALGLVRLPKVPANCQHNGHLFYLLLNEDFEREKVLLSLKKEGIYATFHYVPLHKSKAGQKYCRTHGSLHHTEELAARLIRLPLWRGITLNEQEKVVDALRKALLK